MTDKIFIDRKGDLRQITEDEIHNQRPYKKFIEYCEFRVREIDKKASEEMLEREGKKIVEGIRREDENEEEEFEEEFEALTDEEQADLDEIFDMINAIGDRVAKTVVDEYFKRKERKEKRYE